MALFFLPIGLALPTLSGWLLISAIEGKTPVLSSIERWAAGFIIGLTGTMYATFLTHITGLIRLDRFGFLAVQLFLVVLFFVVSLIRTCNRMQNEEDPEKCVALSGQAPNAVPCPVQPRGGAALKFWGLVPSKRDYFSEHSSWKSTSFWLRAAAVALCIWTVLKIIAMSATFLLTPLYVDDAIDNWNIRGKLIFHHQELVLGFPGDPPPADGGVFAYPPTVSMTKAWFALLAGSWNEPLVNGIHILWFLALLALLFGALRATAGFWWGLLGLYIFGSLPLPLLHATNPYADMFLAAHFGAAACFLLRALWSPQRGESLRFLLLASLPIALLPFTKNEGLVLYFPIMALALVLAVFHLLRRGTFLRGDALRFVVWTFAAVSSVLLPWLFFKWAHGFSFGNAKGLPNVLEFVWNPLSLHAIIVNTVFEGNWLLLFPLFFALLTWQWRLAFSFPLLILSAPFLLTYVLQIALFTFTPLATEAIKQTGYARGIIHLLPIVLLLTILLLYSSLCPPTPRSSATSRT